MSARKPSGALTYTVEKGANALPDLAPADRAALAVADALRVDEGIIELISDYQALGAIDRAAVRKLARALARPKHLRTR